MGHIARLLGEHRNWHWLGRSPEHPEVGEGEATTAAEATAAVDRSWAWSKALADSLTDEELAAPIGPIGGWFAEEDRETFVLHIADELIHHTAEVALLRDLYTARS
jgi:hypothetical protein